MTDQDYTLLLQHFKAGREDAFERVFKLHYKSLHLQALLLLKDEGEAEDQVQQMFVDLWNKKQYRKVQQSIKAYLHASLRNRCLNHLNKLSVHTKLQNEYAGHTSANLRYQNNLDEAAPASPNLLAILAELPIQRRKAFSLVHLQDKKYQEAAREMGISVNSLKTHVKLAVRFLRMRLG